jgi:DNA invertase Pin-like site-specific DNA recombinase
VVGLDVYTNNGATMKKRDDGENDGLGCIYARISKVYGEGEGSLKNQIDQCGVLGAEMKIPVPADMILRERDSGHETIDTRKDMLQLRQWAREGRLRWVLIHAWDRFSRTPEELVTVWKELRNHGVEVICLRNPVHELDLSLAKLILRIQGIAGEMEWEYVARRTTENKQRIRDEGRRVGEGGPLFGYRWKRGADNRIDPSRAWEIVDEEAEIVRLVFHLFADRGLSIRQVMEELNGRGIPPPSVIRGRKFKDGRKPRWTYNLRKMVADPTYKGIATCGRKRRVGKKDYREAPASEWRILENAPTPAIVDEDLWERANAALRAASGQFKRTRDDARRRNAGTGHFAFLRGIIRCACCGGSMRVIRSRQWCPATKDHSGGFKLAYRCDRRWDKSLPPEVRTCEGRAVYDEKVRAAAWLAVLEVITRTGWIEEKARTLKADRPGEAILRDALEIARQELARTERRIGNVIDQMADAEDAEDRADLKLKLASLRREKKGYESRVDSLGEKLRGYDLLDRRCDELVRDVTAIRDTVSDPDALTWEERRKILDGVHARFRGDGETLHLELDLGLADVSPERGPLFTIDISTSMNTARTIRT